MPKAGVDMAVHAATPRTLPAAKGRRPIGTDSSSAKATGADATPRASSAAKVKRPDTTPRASPSAKGKRPDTTPRATVGPKKSSPAGSGYTPRMQQTVDRFALEPVVVEMKAKLRKEQQRRSEEAAKHEEEVASLTQAMASLTESSAARQEAAVAAFWSEAAHKIQKRLSYQ